MAMLRDSDREAIRERLAGLEREVKLVFFSQELECRFCRETHQLLDELSGLHDLLTLEVYNLVTDKEVAEKYNVDKVPAIVLLDADGTDYGIRYFGIPSGYEFASLLEDILMFASDDSGLQPATREALHTLEGEVHMQVFVTPTCPYCPNAVHLAHQMAFESDKVRADMVEATEFPHLAIRYQVQGVPRTVINETHAVEGMMPEQAVLSELLKAV